MWLQMFMPEVTASPLFAQGINASSNIDNTATLIFYMSRILRTYIIKIRLFLLYVYFISFNPIST